MRILPCLLCCLGMLLGAVEGERWEKEWQAHEAKPAPAPGGIACVGSSSMKNWRSLAADLAPMPVWNRAFGGSSTPDQVRALPRLILPHKPRIVVYYCGDNDLANPTADPQRAVKGFQDFVTALRQELPATHVVYLSIKPSPRRAASWPIATKANAAIAAWCAEDPLLTYVDVATPMLDAEGNARPELFAADRLHMNAEGYRLWTGILRPVLATIWDD